MNRIQKITKYLIEKKNPSTIPGLEYEVSKVSSNVYFSIKHTPTDKYVLRLNSTPVTKITDFYKLANSIFKDFDWSKEDLDLDSAKKIIDIFNSRIERQNGSGNYVVKN